MSKSATRSVSKKKARTTTPAKKTRRPLLGYRRFTRSVLEELSIHRQVFGRVLMVAFVALFFASGLTQHGVYAGLTQSTEEVSGQLTAGAFKLFIEVGALFVSVLGGALTSGLSEGQQIYLGVIYLMTWLTTVWLLRHLLAGNAVTMRDGLYSAGAPILSSLVIGAIMLIQILPLAIVAAIFSALSASGILSGWFMVPVVLVLLAIGALTLYWLATSFFAAIVVTLPGTYPWAAVRSARDLIAGRRSELIKRLVWLLAVLLLSFFVFVVPIIAFDAVLGYPFSWLVVGWVILVTAGLFMYASAYVYMLYRGILDESA